MNYPKKTYLRSEILEDHDADYNGIKRINALKWLMG